MAGQPKLRASQGTKGMVAVASQCEQRFLHALRKGANIRTACDYAGISEATYQATVNRRSDFEALVEKARAESEVEVIDVLQHAATVLGDWRAAAKFMEMKQAEKAAPQRVELTGKDGGPVQIEDVRGELLERYNRLASRRAKGEVDKGSESE